jgi:hypothetical protein
MSHRELPQARTPTSFSVESTSPNPWEAARPETAMGLTWLEVDRYPSVRLAPSWARTSPPVGFVWDVARHVKSLPSDRPNVVETNRNYGR